MPAKKKKKESGISIDIKGIPKAEEWKKWEKQWDSKQEDKHGGVFGIVFGLIVLALGLLWMGNEAGWWAINLPFWPLVVVIIGVFILFGSIKGLMYRGKHKPC
jgi:hypothetical protein